MTSSLRWLRFNLIGALGMVVQLAALALFNRLLHGRYLIASAAALELTLLHNFVWHTRYTWRDRRDESSVWPQLLKFHVSNGLLSLGANIVLMRLLVPAAHLPVLPANAIAVLCCSAANFWMGHRWAFSAPPRSVGFIPHGAGAHGRVKTTSRSRPRHAHPPQSFSRTVTPRSISKHRGGV